MHCKIICITEENPNKLFGKFLIYLIISYLDKWYYFDFTNVTGPTLIETERNE